MSCRAWQDLLQQHLDGAGEPGGLDRHLLDCAGCQARQAELRRFLHALTLLRPPPPPADLAARLTAELCREFRIHRARSWRRRLGALAGLVAAAALLLAFGLWWFPGKPPETNQGTTNAAVSPDPPAPLRDPMAQASQAVASLTSRTASDTVGRTATLLPLMSTPGIDTLPTAAPDVEPKLEPLREAADGVSAGLAPMADSARRAVNLFFRDLPMGQGDRAGPGNNPS
jgi:hypothetical protein